MKEIREIWGDSLLQGEAVEILSMKEAGIRADIVEDGSSFTENAVIKAKAVGKKNGKVCLCHCLCPAGWKNAYRAGDH